MGGFCSEPIVMESSLLMRHFAKEKRGKGVAPFPRSVRDKVLKAATELELEVGRPVMRNEIWVYLRNQDPKSLECMPVGLNLFDLVLDDQLLADSEGVTYSARPEMQDTPENPTGFELYSDRIERMFPSFALENNLRIVSGPDTPTVNFNWLKELLLNKDISRNEELDWAQKELRFLDAKVDMTGNRIGFLSFPRTGNTMTRNLIESISGVFTGSNMPLMGTSMFQMMGMAGEGHTCDDKTVWVTKSHWPQNKQTPPFLKEPEFKLDRAIVITRNPIDVMPSLFLLLSIGSHSMTSVQKIHEEFAPEWEAFLQNMVLVFKEYYRKIVEELTKETSVYFFRYEDQTIDARDTTLEFFRFMLDQPDIEGTVLKHRIDDAMKESSEKKSLYKLKSTQFLNRNIGMYTDEQLAFIKKELKDFFFFFGYANNEEDPDNKTPFFKYEKADVTEDDIKRYYGFRAHNTEILAALGKGKPIKTFQICDKTKIKLLVQRPAVYDRITPVKR